ncbi:rho GTPase-activating protein 45 [Tetranychus urticae]|nr:rho GTPase-activating protein 45 [Tetranychus urticae]XP_015790862.1 rho GTPase-activating protein 45 [Tetranychus urticae]
MLFCRTKYINSSADPINYRLSEYLMGGVKSNGNNNDMTGFDSISSSSPPELDDPEARSLLTPNDCDNRFLHLPEGIDLALHRTKLWSKYAKDLINYIDKRTNLEADHVRNLTKLAQSVKPILKEEKYLPLQSIYLQALDNDLDNSCATLANCSLLMGHKFIEPLAARRAEHEKMRKQIKSEWNRELKRTHEALSNLRKARMVYFQRKQEYERLRALSNLAPELSHSSEMQGSIIGGPGAIVGGCYGGSDQASKCERKKRIEEEACLRAQEAEIIYRNAINEANARTRSCEELKKNLLTRIRELIYQCDQTLKAVTIGYFECQHNLLKPIVGQFGALSDLTKLYEPASEYADYVQHLPEFTEKLRKCNGSYGNYKFDPSINSMTSIKEQPQRVNCNNKHHNLSNCPENGVDSVNKDHLKSSNNIGLPINSSGDEIDGVTNYSTVGNGYECTSKSSTLPITAQSHHFRKLKTPSRCRHCDAYVCFQGLECINCGLTCHTKCRIELTTIKCSNRRMRGLSKKMTTFGVDLKSHGDEIPYIIVKCITELDNRGIMVKGLYRVSGVKSKVDKLCQFFESSTDSIDIEDVHPNVIANVLKLYLRQLPEPLITFKLYSEFIRIAKQYPSNADGNGPDSDDASIAVQIINQFKQVTQNLPTVHYQTLAFLCHHLKRVADQSEVNNMPSSNLGIVFGPTLLRSSEGDSLSSLVDTGHQARAVQLLITYVDQIFGPSEKLTNSIYNEIDGNEPDLVDKHFSQNELKETNRTQITLTLEGNNNLYDRGELNDKPQSKNNRIISNNYSIKNIKNSNNNNNTVTINNNNNNNNKNNNKINENDNNNVIGLNNGVDGKRSLDRERLSPTPSIYSSSAVIKLSGQQIITGPSSLIHSSLPNYDDSDDRLNRSNVIGGSRHSLYEARRQFFASPTSLTSSSSLSSSPLSTSTSNSSIRPHSLVSGSISLNSQNHSTHHNHSHSHHQSIKQTSSQPSSSTLSSPATSPSNTNELQMAMSSLSLTRPRKASIISNGPSLSLGTNNNDNSNNMFNTETNG